MVVVWLGVWAREHGRSRKSPPANHSAVNGRALLDALKDTDENYPQAGAICVTLDPSISLATVVPVVSADFQYDDTIASSGKLSFIEPTHRFIHWFGFPGGVRHRMYRRRNRSR